MIVTDILRGLVFQRRMARALERIADSLATLERIESARRLDEAPVRPRTATEFGMLDVRAANETWRKAQVAAGLIPEDEEE